MSAKLKTVVLMGQLGKKFGRRFQFQIKNPAEAIRALCANLPGFEKHLCQSEEGNIGYRIIVGADPLQHERELKYPNGNNVIKIVPAIVGGKNAIGKIFVGAAIAALAIVTIATGGATTPLALAFTHAALGIGAGLAIGGIAQVIAGNPKSGVPQEDDGNTPSYSFNGPVNTTAQGHPVPIGYGRMIVGSAVVSAGIEVNQLKRTGSDLFTEQGAIDWSFVTK